MTGCVGCVTDIGAESEISNPCSNAGLGLMHSLSHKCPWGKHTCAYSPSYGLNNRMDSAIYLG